jgi:uncharacterized protein (TIGR02118 family)
MTDTITVYVTYEGTPDTRFDKSYYVSHHLPLVMRAWHKYGLTTLAAFFPAIEQPGTIAICECKFRNEVSMKNAFGSSETPEVMADVPLFTDAQPKRSRLASI